MRKLDPNNSIPTVLENICVVLALPCPPQNFSADDWYWKKICGIPFLLRNIFSIQRVGLNSLIIYSNKENATTYKQLCKEKEIFIKLTWVTDITDVIKSTKDQPVLVLNGGALHTQKEIQSALNSQTIDDEISIKYLERKSMTRVVNQIVLENKFSLAQSDGNSDLEVTFLPGAKNSCINQPQDFSVQHENLLKNSGLNNDSFGDKIITRFFSRQFTRLFLHTSLSPNIITLFSLSIGLMSAGYFFQGTYRSNLIGAGLLLLSAWIDCTDGEIARLKFMESKIGGKLDVLCDNIVHIAVFFSIGMGLYNFTRKDIFIILGTFAAIGSLISFLLLNLSIVDEKEKAAANRPGFRVKSDLTAKLANRDFIYFLALMAAIGRVDIFISITAVGSNFFASYLIYSRIKSFLLPS